MTLRSISAASCTGFRCCLTDIPGVSTVTAQAILTEVGPDISRFRHASAFASWLGLCPEKRVSGGKVYPAEHAQSRIGLPMPCSLSRAMGYFGEFFRRMRAKLGTPSVITATAHKIARVICHVLLTKKPNSVTSS
jgi:hypothetical protein